MQKHLAFLQDMDNSKTYHKALRFPHKLTSMETINLDAGQQKAVKHFQGPALVVAGPGSGKTTVIKERILHLIQKHNVDPEHILAIAFTNAAADEMRKRLSSEPALKDSKPKICTLHVFGKDLIKAHYKEADLAYEPNNTWDDEKVGAIINKEKSRLRAENEERPIAIYKIEDRATRQCYIGQTINPDRRKKEHFDCSSNRRLREAIQQKGEEAFDFRHEWVAGIEADREETYRINSYKKRAAVNLNKGHEQIEKVNSNIPITIYKIESPTTVTCYFGQTTDLDSIDRPEGFEIIGEEDTWDQASKLVELEIEKHKNWAVFNEDDPLHARDSTRCRIEVFCKYFDVSYHEVLEHTQKFEHEMRKFNGMNEDIVKEKSKVYTERFDPETISDPVLRAFAKRYEDRKTEAKAIDFLDMLILSANMLENNQARLREYREKYRYVFVDEFQDISPLDFRLIDLFSENLFAVGDDDQAIYGFRGGDSEIMKKKFGNRENVKIYKITRNYRSTSTIVRHAKALIEHNPDRIPKNLYANNFVQSHVEVLLTNQKAIKGDLVRELSKLSTTDFQEIGILARNWLGEINKIQEILDCSELETQGFEIVWEVLDDPGKDLYDPNAKNRRIMVIRRGVQKIEVLNIHTAKGREWDKVILLVNTMYESLPRAGNDPIDERRLFYVAATRARQELVVLDGGNCRFVSEFQNAPLTKEELEEIFEAELAKQESKFKIEWEEATKAALVAREPKLKIELEEVTKVARKQYEPEFNRLRRVAAEAENTKRNVQKQIIERLPQQSKTSNNALLEELIPVLDTFESQLNSLRTTIESNDIPVDLAPLTENIQLAHKQMLDSLKDYGLRPIETYSEIFNPTYYEEISPAVYSDEVRADRVVHEERRGYLLHDRVVRKAQVVISKGENIRALERLDRVVDIYLKRLIFAFQAKYKLNNIDQSLVKQEMMKYLLELGDESLWEIVSFSSKDKAEAIQLKRYTDYCAGQEKIHRCTDVFRGFWNKMWEVINTLNENIKQVDAFVSQNFAQPVRFVTYEGFRDLRNIKMFNDGVKGLDSQDEEVQLQHLNLLFVFPKGDMAALKSHIKKRPTIADQKLQPLEIISERLHIADDILKPLLVKKDSMELDDPDPTVQLVTRSGHVLNGHLWNFDEDFFYMNINKKDVIVYRAGILEFKNLIWIQITKAYKGGAPISGHVTKRIRGGLQVKFRSLTGFLPISQVELYTIQQPDSYIGKTYEMMVIEINKTNNHFVLSRRTWLKEQRTKFLKSLSELSDEFPKSRDITSMHKTVEAIPGANQSPHVPQAQRIPLDKSISLIIPEPIEEVIGTPLSMSTGFTESLDTYVKDLKPETLRTVEVRRDPLHEPIDLIVPKPIKKVVDSRFPMPKGFSGILNSQIQNLTPETLEIEIGSNPSEKVNNNSQLTAQECGDILKTQIQNLKPATFEPDITSEPPVAVNSNAQKTPQEHDDILLRQIQELKAEISTRGNPDNITPEPTSETEVDRETSFTCPDPSTVTDSDARQIKEQDSPKSKGGDPKKSLGDYLRRGGRFAVEKIRTTIFRKPRL